QFLRSQELVIIREFGKVADPLTGDRFAHVHIKNAGRAARGRDKPQEHIHSRGLAGAVGAEETENLSGMNLEAQSVDRDFHFLTELAGSILHHQVFDLQDRCHAKRIRIYHMACSGSRPPTARGDDSVKPLTRIEYEASIAWRVNSSGRENRT